ncbi:MAG: DUF418 domain-containing protein [Chitinophagaceae bacterium]
MDENNSNNPQAIVIPLEANEPPGRDGAGGTAPVSGADRIKSIDTIRGVALLGILMMNIPGFGINWDFWYTVTHSQRSGKDYYTFATVFVFFEGTMRGLFSMLFGAGMVLFMMNKKEIPGQPTVAEYYYRRLLWLVLFGLINAFVLLWPGDILFFYGLCGMLLFAFRKLKPKWLLVIALACVSIGIVKNQWGWNEFRTKRAAYTEAVDAKKEKKKLTEEQQGAITKWTQIEKNQKPDTATTNNNLRKMRSDYGTIFTYFIPRNANGEIQYMYHGLWDMLAMMFLGMALFAWGFFSNKLRTSTYALWLLAGYGIGIPMGWILFDKGWMSWASIGPSAFTDAWRSAPEIFAEFRRIPITIGHASLVMLIFRSRLVPWLMKALANVGQMAFTNYLMQSIICTWFFYGYGFGNYNKLRFHQLYYVVFSVWLFQLLFSTVWLRFFRFGPFEWLWRSLTYWKKQPMRK